MSQLTILTAPWPTPFRNDGDFVDRTQFSAIRGHFCRIPVISDSCGSFSDCCGSFSDSCGSFSDSCGSFSDRSLYTA